MNASVVVGVKARDASAHLAADLHLRDRLDRTGGLDGLDDVPGTHGCGEKSWRGRRTMAAGIQERADRTERDDRDDADPPRAALLAKFVERVVDGFRGGGFVGSRHV